MPAFQTFAGDHWASLYIGKPWQSGTIGPNAYDCWGLVKTILERHYNIRVPLIKVAEDNLKAIVREFRDHPERQRWALVENPQDGNVVLLRQSRYPCHVGLWLDVDHGGILHCMQGCGVVFQKERDLKVMGWHIEGFYRYGGKNR
jgi:hypothetical protein